MLFSTLGQIAAESLESESSDRSQFGGKAYNLVRLIRAGFPVPACFVIPTSVFEYVIQSALEKTSQTDMNAVIAGIKFDAGFVDALGAAMRQIGGTRWAVRSSSTDEDSQTHSFAGLQESVIGVSSIESCLEAIKTVWQSFYARERLLYPTQASLSGPVPAMAVIVQVYVDSESAGVVFTQHPFEGKDKMLVNVSHGQGANVVDGKGGVALTIEKHSAEICEDYECLSAHQLSELSRMACQIEEAFGRPQDVEFAFASGCLYILQTRDIVEQNGPASKTLYSNVNVGEALSGVSTPMTWSVGKTIARQGFDTVFASFGLSVPETYDFITTFHGHIYLNISQMLSVMSQIPFINASILGKVAGIQDIREYACAVDPIGKSHFIRNLPHSMLEMIRLQKRMSQLDARAEAFERERDALLAIELKHASKDEIQEAFDRLNRLFFDCAFDMLSAGGIMLASYVLCSGFIQHFGEEETREIEHYLFSGLLDVQSAAPGLKLLDMASKIRQYPALRQAFLDEPTFDDLDGFLFGIEKLDGYSEFHSAFESFLSQYGARTTQEAELANPRWREDPRFLYQVIQKHLHAESACTAQTIVESVSTHREARTSEFKSMLSRSLRPIFKLLLTWTQKNARLREKWRAYVVDVLGIFRQYFLDVAQQLKDCGILGRVDDIFFLTYDEFRAGLAHPKSFERARLKVAFRRARHEAYLSARILPDTFLTHPNQCSEESGPPTSKVLSGIPASPGCVQARVRVARTIEEAAALEYGEILVAPSTDIGWTPLFLVASAILTERGGPLSHAFVVAREYGIPAVVSIPGLLESLKTGDLANVSGEKGVVTIL